MLSFIDEKTCADLADGVIRNACEYAASNPALALGVTAGTLALGAVGGLFWRNRSHAVPVSQIAPARHRRERVPLLDTIAQVNVDAQKLDVSVDEAPANMPVQTIVDAYIRAAMAKLDKNRLEITKLLCPRDVAQMSQQLTQADINKAVLKRLGLPADGSMPATLEGRRHFNEKMTSLQLEHFVVKLSSGLKI